MPYHGWGMDHMGGFGWAMTAGMVFWSLLSVALIALAVVALARMLNPKPTEFRSSMPDATSQALAILAERYARGEIDHDEYIKRRDTIMSPGRH